MADHGICQVQISTVNTTHNDDDPLQPAFELHVRQYQVKSLGEGDDTFRRAWLAKAAPCFELLHNVPEEALVQLALRFAHVDAGHSTVGSSVGLDSSLLRCSADDLWATTLYYGRNPYDITDCDLVEHVIHPLTLAGFQKLVHDVSQEEHASQLAGHLGAEGADDYDTLDSYAPLHITVLYQARSYMCTCILSALAGTDLIGARQLSDCDCAPLVARLYVWRSCSMHVAWGCSM
jgi:hypothetical protein